MSEESVTQIRPHEQVLLMAVLKRSLDEASAQRLLDEVLTAAGARPAVPVVLDISQVRFAPSAALGVLVKLSRSFRLDGRRIALVGVDPRVRGTIMTTRLDAVLEIHDSVEQVLGASRRDR